MHVVKLLPLLDLHFGTEAAIYLPDQNGKHTSEGCEVTLCALLSSGFTCAFFSGEHGNRDD